MVSPQVAFPYVSNKIHWIVHREPVFILEDEDSGPSVENFNKFNWQYTKSSLYVKS